MAKKPSKPAKRPAKSKARPVAAKRTPPKSNKRPPARKAVASKKPAKAKTAPAKAAPAKKEAAAARPAPRPPRPAGMAWLSPYLTVRDAKASLQFYEKAFGFKKKNSMADADGVIKHAEMTWKDAVIMFGAEGANKAPATGGNPCPMSLYVYCDDVDALFQRAAAAGATVSFSPKDMFYGDRMCGFQDPDGYIWNFATNVAAFDPSKTPF